MKKNRIPSKLSRILSVWRRHNKVYFSNFGNAFPPIVEPFVFLLGIGLGLGQYIDAKFMEVEYIVFLAPALAADVAMWSSTFECTYGTYIRLHFEKVYHPMASTPVSVEEVFLGEILFAGTKGFLYSLIVVVEMALMGYIDSIFAVGVPFVGFLGGLVFGSMGLLVTSLVKSINSINFYISGFITPLFFISGTFFPVDTLPKGIHYLSYIMPLTHVIDLMRGLAYGKLELSLVMNLLILIVSIIIISYISIRNIKKLVII